MVTQTSNKQSSVENLIFYVSLLLLAAMVGVFFYLQYLVNQRTEEAKVLEAEASKAKTAEQKEMEDNILFVKQELNDFSTVIDSHKLNSILLKQFDGLAHQEVYFSKFNLSTEKGIITASGNAKSLIALGEQILAMEGASDVMGNVRLDKASIGDEGDIAFELSIKVNDEVAAFKKAGGVLSNETVK